MLLRSLLDGVIYGAYDGETLAMALQLRPSYTGTPDWQQITTRYDTGLAGTASSLTYGTRALLEGTKYGILSTGAYGRLHRVRFTGASIVGRYRRSFAVLYASDFSPRWTVQDKERITWTAASDGAAWAVSDEELVRWTPLATVSGWSVQDAERVRWLDIGNAWQVTDQEIVRWQGTVSGSIGPGAWSIEDAESVRWFGTAGTATDCSTGDGVPGTGAGGGGATIRNFVY